MRAIPSHAGVWQPRPAAPLADWQTRTCMYVPMIGRAAQTRLGTRRLSVWLRSLS